MAKRNAKPPVASISQQPLSLVDEIDRRALADALRKMQAGDKLTASDRAVIKRHEAAREERVRWLHYRSIPQKHWREMSGRQARTINEQAERYGIPFAGKSIDLPAVVKALHDFFAANASKLGAPETDDPLLSGAPSPALEKYRLEKARLAELDRLERERRLIPREVLHDLLARMAASLRSAGEHLDRQHGPEAHAVLEEALDDVSREIRTFFGRLTEDSDAITDDDDDDDGSPSA